MVRIRAMPDQKTKQKTKQHNTNDCRSTENERKDRDKEKIPT